MMRFKLDIDAIGFEVLPDGSGVVYESGGQLMLRHWDALDPVPIPGTQGVGAPVGRAVVSPSGQEVAFVADRQLKVASLAGGVVRTLVPEDALCCMRWGPDDYIYYSPQRERNIRRVLATGGPGEDVTQRGEEAFHGFFQVLPGGEVALFSTTTRPYRVEAVRMSTGERRTGLSNTTGLD